MTVEQRKGLRASDGDRDRVLVRLHTAYAEGRLTEAELDERIDHALELSDAYRGTAFLLGDVVEADDAYTGSHSRHVVDLVLAVCDKMGLKGSDRRDAEFVALLHDVGKIKIPAAIINKPGALTAEERKVIETHTVEGQQMLDKRPKGDMTGFASVPGN